MSRIGITIVIPTLNRGQIAADCAKDLLAQDYAPLEILIVDQSDAPSRELQTLSEHHPNIVRWHRVSFRGLPAARNYGWQHARYEAVLFVDDDIRCGSDLAAKHARALCKRNVGVVGGGIDELQARKGGSGATGAFNFWTATPLGGFDSAEEMDVDHVRGCNFSTWRKVLAQVGGVDEHLQVGASLYEETEFCLRVKKAGFRVLFSGRARVTHLAVHNGGCRVPDIPAYVYGLAHNRAILIGRHLHWYQVPTALVELTRLAFAYAVRYRETRVLVACVRGCLCGFIAQKQGSLCTCYDHPPGDAWMGGADSHTTAG